MDNVGAEVEDRSHDDILIAVDLFVFPEVELTIGSVNSPSRCHPDGVVDDLSRWNFSEEMNETPSKVASRTMNLNTDNVRYIENRGNDTISYYIQDSPEVG